MGDGSDPKLLRLPTPEELLEDHTASDWLKCTLRSALARDPVDATNDAEILAAVLDERLRGVLKSKSGGH